MKARTRIAPSPTGYMHIGTLRTALFNYYLAKQTGGEFIIRIEDTDRSRLVEGAVEDLLKVFKKLGLEHDEGPFLDENGVIDEKGEYGPYIQSQRLDIYHQYLEKLQKDGHVYKCFCTKERLDEMRTAQKATKQTTKYDRKCCQLSDDEIQQKIEEHEPFVVRLKVPDGETIFEDVIRGKIKISNNEVDDQVLLKSDGFPTYHLAVVVDDHLMKITHVIRGEEWLPSTPKQVILCKMLGFNLPKFAHTPNLLNPDKTKLSKRQGEVAVEDYLKRGYLPETLLNFVGTLGFNPSGEEEIYSLDELVKNFKLEKVNKAGAVLNIEKLDWMNNQYLRKMDKEPLREAVRGFVQANVDDENVMRAIMIERERVDRLDQLQERLTSYLTDPAYDSSVLIWKKADKEDAVKQLSNIKDLLGRVGEDKFEKIESIESEVKSYIEENELSNGNVLWPLRVALSGQERSASPFELLWALGKGESLKRIDYAISLLSS